MTTTPDWDSQPGWITQSAIPAPPDCVVAIRDGDGDRCVHTAAALLVQGHLGLDHTRVVVGVLDSRGHVVPAEDLGRIVYAANAAPDGKVVTFS